MPAVYQLLGFPGTGKYTVAQEIVQHLAAKGEPVALLDNHATANLVWSLVPEDQRFAPDVLSKMNELRAVLLDAAAELTGPHHSIVFTNFVPAGRSMELLERHRSLAAQLRRPFVAVVLSCDRDEVLRRVANADRVQRMKLVDAEVARSVMASGMAIPEWPELVHLDVTELPPAEAAAHVVELADQR